MNPLNPKKQMFVSCNPTLTRFYSEKSLPLSFSALPTPNQHETFFEDKKSKEIILLTYPIFEETKHFLGLIHYVWLAFMHTFINTY